jgi:5-methylthioadenosine/S-adenosylhomocysteine deaminase
MSILLENAAVVTLNSSKAVIEGQQIFIRDGTIAQFGRKIHTRGLPITKRIDCSGMIVMPGLVNAHSHLTEILQKSFRDNVRMEIWRGYRATTEDLAHLTPEEIGTAAELACSEMLKNGVTAVVDHFSTRPGLTVDKWKLFWRVREDRHPGMSFPLRDQDFISLGDATRPKKHGKQNVA